ncbi:MAG: hypothetical protein V3R81_15395 [Gammaproteobacteria bacterium]
MMIICDKTQSTKDVTFILFDTETGLEYSLETTAGDDYRTGVTLWINSAASAREDGSGLHYAGQPALNMWEQLSGLNNGNDSNFTTLHDEGYNTGVACLELRAAFEARENERTAKAKEIDDHLMF